MDIRSKFKDIEAVSMGSHESLVLSFHGFQDREEVKEFADFIFSVIFLFCLFLFYMLPKTFCLRLIYTHLCNKTL